ncbi:MAG: HEAT repeat domain-containing protein [Dehalococcoidales bacterium]|nr:HEAT repeat domain-containing protein [Dehalococcoidales bacterium]
MVSPVDEIIIELGHCEQPPLYSKLAELSNLTIAAMELFKRSWATIDTERRRQVIARLVELTEDNLELNFDAIFKHCLQDQDAEVQNKAIEGLWENEEASLINPLVDLLDPENAEKVQVTAATALGKFAMLAEHKKLRDCHRDKVQEALLSVINDKNRTLELRRRALEAVAPLSLPQVNKTILAAYQSDDSRLKVSAIYAMGQNCSPSWLPVLLKELENTEAAVRYEAACSCGELEEEEAVPHLINLVKDTDIDIQMAAIRALAKIGGTQAEEFLELCLENADEAIRQAAEQALSGLEQKEDMLPFPFQST